MKNNILYVITKLELGGAQKHLLGLLTNLDRGKFNIFLFTAKEGLLLNDALAIKGLSVWTSSFLERRINPFKDVAALFEIYHFIKRNNIDIVHTHSSKAGILGRFAARLAGAKAIVHTVHGWSFNDYQPFFMRWIYILVERFTAKFSDKLIVVSYCDKAKGLENRIGNNNKYVLIRYGINFREFNVNDCDIRRELGINNRDLAVGMISCLKPQKSPQDFIRLAKLVNQGLPHTKFILVGDGVLRKKIERLINKYKLSKIVVLTGWRRDIPEILSTIDIFVLTSLWEGMPIAVLEAIASFKPVITTYTGGISEIIHEGDTGFLVPPQDMDSMAEKLKALLMDEALRRQIAQKAKNYINSNFGIENMAKNTQGLYECLTRRYMDVQKERSGYG